MNVLITGGTGFLGKHLVDAFSKTSTSYRLTVAGSKDVDLRNLNSAINYFSKVKPDVIVSLAAKLGGIGDSVKNPSSYFYDNLMIGVNTNEAARITGISKVINIGSACSYPKDVTVPYKEEDFWNGYPEPSNGAYGIAKKAVGEFSLAISKEHDMKTCNLILSNLYGPGDDFRDETSHVIPALIKKIFKAKQNNDPHIVAWGDGTPTRDFLYVTDAAQAIVKSIDCDYSLPINIGSGIEVSIKELFQNICGILDYDGEVVWDTSKPNGQPRRSLDISKAREILGFKPEMSFQTGLKNTIEWYLSNKEYIDSLGKKFS